MPNNAVQELSNVMYFVNHTRRQHGVKQRDLPVSQMYVIFKTVSYDCSSTVYVNIDVTHTKLVPIHILITLILFGNV